MRSSCPAGVLLLVLAIVAVVSAKGMTTRIVVTGTQLGAPIELRDRDVVGAFNVWSGPGTRINGVEAMDGFIVDWRSGAVEPKVSNLWQFEISFYVDENSSGSNRPVYVVSYGLNPLSGDGYVYLPGRADPRWGANVRSIFRGAKYEGRWFRTTAAWQDVMRTYVIGKAPAAGPAFVH
jgi:hypothetical protein